METTIWICLFVILVVIGPGFWMLSKDIRALHSTVHPDLDRIEKILEEIRIRDSHSDINGYLGRIVFLLEKIHKKS